MNGLATTAADNIMLVSSGNIIAADIHTGGTGATVTLNAGIGGTITDNGGAGIATGTLNITRALSVGASGATLDVNIDTLSIANVSGNVYVRESNTVDLNTVTVGGILDVTATAGNITATQVNAVGGATTLTAEAGGIAAGDINAGVQTVTLDANGAITNIAGDIDAGILNITDAASVGTALANLDTNVATLQMSNVDGASYITNEVGIVLNPVSVDGALYVTTEAGDITATDVDTSNDNVILTAAGNIVTEDINTNGTGATVTLNAGTGGTITDNGGAGIATGTLDITRALSVGASGATLDVNIDTLSIANVSGNAYVRESNTVDLNTVTVGGILDVTATAGNITATEINATGGATTLMAEAGSIAAGDINAGVRTVTLDANGAITNIAGDIDAGILNITDAASVGTALANLDTNVATLQMSNVDGASYITNEVGIVLNPVSVDGALYVMTEAGDITATDVDTSNDNVILTAAGNIVTEDINTNGTGATVTLNAGAGNTITDNGGAGIASGTLDITRALSVGASGATLDINVDTLSMNNVSGNAYVRESNTVDLNNVTVGGILEVTATAGDITATDVDTSNDNVILTAAGNIVTEDVNTNGTGATVTLNAGAGSTITDNGGAGIATGTLDITRALSVGASGATLDINVDTLSMNNVSGNVYVRESNTVDLNTVTAGGILGRYSDCREYYSYPGKCRRRRHDAYGGGWRYSGW